MNRNRPISPREWPARPMESGEAYELGRTDEAFMIRTWLRETGRESIAAEIEKGEPSRWLAEKINVATPKKDGGDGG